MVNEAFAEERQHLRPLPLAPFRSVLKLERRISREGMVSVGGNAYSVPDATRSRLVEVHSLADEVRIFENGTLIAVHPVLEGRKQRRVHPDHRRSAVAQRSWPKVGDAGVTLQGAGDKVPQRSLAFYDAVGQALAREEPPMSAKLDTMPSMIDRIRHDLVGLKMPRALEALDHVVRRLEHGELSALEAIDILLSEELTLRENSRIKTALRMGRLATIKTLAGFDFTFQPSLDKDRIFTLAQLSFIERNEAVHFLGPPDPTT